MEHLQQRPSNAEAIAKDHRNSSKHSWYWYSTDGICTYRLPKDGRGGLGSDSSIDIHRFKLIEWATSRMCAATDSAQINSIIASEILNVLNASLRP